MGVDIPSTIRRFKDHIVFIHFRDIVGTPTRFRETWQDNGKTDMFEAMKVYVELGLDCPVRPDHVPVLAVIFDQPPSQKKGNSLCLIN